MRNARIFTRGMAVLALVVAGGTVTARGDEGMWLFNNPPSKLLKEKYGFEPDRRLA